MTLITETNIPPSIIMHNTISGNLISVNYHIIKACNYRCKFCFAHFNQVKDNYLPFGEADKLVRELVRAGAEKITFVGGEPTLVPYLPELVIRSKRLGLTTMIVTNGTKINASYLARFKNSLDWVGLSIDSTVESTSQKLGRGTGNHVQQTLAGAVLLKKEGIRIKLNTVITSLNYDEDMNWILEIVNPDRWKVFKMLLIEGENDNARELLIKDKQFKIFLERHAHNNPIAENDLDMIDSYVMIDPEGRFYSNSDKRLRHGQRILDVGVSVAFTDINFKIRRLEKRGGIYEW